jgi:23S rRNA pseudouridine1911/1915/1917 synthase
MSDDVDVDDDLLPEPDAAPPARRSRDPVEMRIQVKSEGMRLDHYIPIFFPDFSRSEIQRAITAGTVTINGHTVKPSYKVRNEDRLKIILPEPTHDLPQPEDIPLDVLYEDEWLALVNKPWNMVVHPAKGNWSGTLVNALQFRFKDQLSLENGTYRAGIVHRLDKDTSGVILVAKDAASHHALAAQFEKRKVFKEYVAIVAGELDRDSDYIDGPMKQHPHDRLRMIVSRDPDAKPANSYYEVLERFRGFTLVKIQPRTGRTHQIRVHLAHVGCPVLADRLYGGRDSFKLSDVVAGTPEGQDEVLLNRQALHALRLRFTHPQTGSFLEAEAPLPPDMRRTLELLRVHRAKR